jgi:hypothetical protein
MSKLKDQMEIGRAITMHNRVRGIKPVREWEKRVDLLVDQLTLVASQRDAALRKLLEANEYISNNLDKT